MRGGCDSYHPSHPPCPLPSVPSRSNSGSSNKGGSVSRKPLALVAGIVAFFAASYFTRQAIDFVHRDPQISKQILEKSWVEQGLGGTSLAFNVPWNLQPQDLSLPSQLAKLIQSSVTMSHEA